MSELELFDTYKDNDGYTYVDVINYVKLDAAIAEHGPLAVSIAKWQFIVDALSEDASVHIIDGGHDTCALCRTYFDGSRDYRRCGVCPISIDIGREYCDGTPYRDYVLAINPRHLSNALEELAYLRELESKVADNPDVFNYTWEKENE